MTLTPRSRIASPVNSRSPAFHFEAIEPGEYRLSASRPGYVNKEYGSRTRQGFGSGATLKLEKAQKLPQLDIKLIPHAVITGRIVDEDGDPVPYADVQLLRFLYSQGSRQLTPFAGASTDDLGEYRMFGVAPGKYYLSVMNRKGMAQTSALILRAAKTPILPPISQSSATPPPPSNLRWPKALACKAWM